MQALIPLLIYKNLRKNFVLVKTLNVFGEWDKFKDFDIKI